MLTNFSENILLIKKRISSQPEEERIRETISPYNPKASAKIKIRIIPTKIAGY